MLALLKMGMVFWVMTLWTLQYLKNKLMNCAEFLHADINAEKQKNYFNNFMTSYGQKSAWSFRSCDSKICFVSIINWWNELIFCRLVQIRKVRNYFIIIGGVWSKMLWPFGLWHSKIFNELSWFFAWLCEFRKA